MTDNLENMDIENVAALTSTDGATINEQTPVLALLRTKKTKTPIIPYVNPADESEFGVVKVDGVTIRSNNGVLSTNFNSSGGRNVGEIIPSALPLTDAGLHLLDGTRLSGDGIYGEFVDYIADLYTENPSANYFTTESDWQASVSQYGSCGKFVYDSTLNTVRLPKVSDILQGTTDLNALGSLVQAGLPPLGIYTEFGATSNASYSPIVSNTYMQIAGANAATRVLKTDVIESGVSNSNTVQPQTIKCFVYIVIATSTKTAIQIDIDEVATDLNGKADTDLNNVSPSTSFYTDVYNNIYDNVKNRIKTDILPLGMPNYNAGINMANGSIAPYDGFLRMGADPSNSNNWATVHINYVEVYRYKHNDGYPQACDSWAPISKGDIITTADNIVILTLYPLKGAN